MNPGDNATWEYLVMMANETGKDLYITIPMNANQAYVTDLANLLRYGSDGVNPYTSYQAHPAYPGLNSNLSVYVEWANEIWNWAGGFGQSQAGVAAAAEAMNSPLVTSQNVAAPLQQRERLSGHAVHRQFGRDRDRAGAVDLAGNSNTHTVDILDSNGNVLASANVNLSGGTTGTFVYATLELVCKPRSGQHLLPGLVGNQRWRFLAGQLILEQSGHERADSRGRSYVDRLGHADLRHGQHPRLRPGGTAGYARRADYARGAGARPPLRPP